MTNKTMYFGVRGFMQFVPCAAIDGDFSSVGYAAKDQYLSGQAGVRTSTGSHKEYSLTWNMTARDDLRPITDYADGVYDTTDGVNLIYWLDPMAMNKNVLPQIWATPSQARADGLTLFPGQTPGVVQTPANTLLYPARSATYVANTSSSSVWIPIPPGYTFWIGAHGTATGTAGVTVTTTSGLSTLTTTTLTLLPVTSTTRVNASFDGSTCDGVLISYKNNGPSSTDVLTLSGMIGQILPTGATPLSGGFISGQGHSGCQFDQKPSVTPHSAALDLVAMSAKLTETGTGL